MKKIASLLVLLFLFVQVVPAITTFLTEKSGMFLVDEERGSEKTEKGESKDLKEYQTGNSKHGKFVQSINVQHLFRLSEKIALSPCIENHTPPPDIF